MDENDLGIAAKRQPSLRRTRAYALLPQISRKMISSAPPPLTHTCLLFFVSKKLIILFQILGCFIFSCYTALYIYIYTKTYIFRNLKTTYSLKRIEFIPYIHEHLWLGFTGSQICGCLIFITTAEIILRAFFLGEAQNNLLQQKKQGYRSIRSAPKNAILGAGDTVNHLQKQPPFSDVGDTITRS